MNFLSNIKSYYESFYQKIKGSIPNTLYLIPILFLLSCSEDLDIRNGLISNDRDDYISLNFIIPAEKHVSTRADEDTQIKKLTLFLFNKESETFLQKKELSDSELISSGVNQYQVKFDKIDDVKKTDQLTIYAFANVDFPQDLEQISDIKNITELENLISTKYKNSNGFFMSGKAHVSSSTTVELVRSAGKISVKEAKTDTDDDAVTNFELTGFYIYNTAEKEYVTVGISNKLMKGKKGVNDAINAQYFSQMSTNELYVQPTQTHTFNNTEDQPVDIEDVDITTYVVVEGKYKDKDSAGNDIEIETFYALPLYNRETREHYNIEPNHWYDITIKEVKHAGQTTKEDAVLVPCDYIIYEIHDHTPEIYSMESDGIHELGVTHSVSLEEINNYTATFRVKWYSASPKDLVNFKYDDEIKIIIDEGEDWMEIKGQPQEKQNEDNEDNFGVQYEYTVTIKEGERRYTSQEGKIIVFWWENKNDSKAKLSREIIVRYDPGFHVEQSCSAKLMIYENDGSNKELITTIEDYWEFLKNRYSKKLFGVNENSMADGKIRDRGFHFPMPYGETDSRDADKVGKVIKPWSYEYELDFTKLKEVLKNSDDTSIEITKIDYNVTGNSFKKEDFSIVGYGDSRTLKLIKTFGNEYEYLTGKIIFHIEYIRTKEGESTTSVHSLTMDLYHTGFFHLEENLNYVLSIDAGYYYYEVVPMEGGYWLDRNILAKSNMMYVDDELNGMGNKDAKGKLLQIADNTELLYQKPKIDQDMCPPGYHIPVTSEWNDIRLSNKFTLGSATIGTETFTTTNYISSTGMVYFPTARYYNKRQPGDPNESNMGDASTGYYWTATEAPGMEKLEMGNWLRGLYIHGKSTTYMNFHTGDTKMMVRCKAGGKIPEQENYYVSFNVHNATHVYLFNKETKSPLYTFPGHAVSSAKSSEQWQYFSCTTSVPLNELGMIFVKIDANERVTLYIKKDNSFEEITNNYTEIITEPKAEQYWLPNVSENYYDFCSLAKNRDNVTQNMPTIKDPDHPEQSIQCNASPEVTGRTNFKVEFPDIEEILEVGQLTLRNMGTGNNQDLANGNFDWTQVKENSVLKIYVEALDNSTPGIKLFAAGWSWIGEYWDSRAHKSDANLLIFDIRLDSGIISNLHNNNGLIMQGANLKLKGMTLIKPEDAGNNGNQGGGNDNEEENGDKISGYFIWDQRTELNWNPGFTKLISTHYDWTEVKAGSVLIIEFDYNDYYNCQICIGGKNNEQITDIQQQNGNWNYDIASKKININLTEIMLSDIKNKGGILIWGNGYLTKVELIMSQ